MDITDIMDIIYRHYGHYWCYGHNEPQLTWTHIMLSVTFYYVNCSRIPHFKSYNIANSLYNISMKSSLLLGQPLEQQFFRQLEALDSIHLHHNISSIFQHELCKHRIAINHQSGTVTHAGSISYSQCMKQIEWNQQTQSVSTHWCLMHKHIHVAPMNNILLCS